MALFSQTVQTQGLGLPTNPTLGGWGGVRLKDTVQNMTGPASAVFLGEKASNFEQIALRENQLGYNAIRASFAPYCSVRYGLSNSSPPDFMGNYTQGELTRAITIAEHLNMWIVVDYHGYADFTNTTLIDCWLGFWFGPSNVTGAKGVVGAFMDQYSRIVWEPLNEPNSNSFPVSTTTWCMRNPFPCETNKTAYATIQYQLWLDEDRAAGDTHWVVIQNLCSYGCGLDRPEAYLDYPNVNDTIQRVYESLHTYMYYPNMAEHVAYDSNNDSIYDSGDVPIVGFIFNNTALANDPRLEFVNATNTPSETWGTGKAVIDDADNNGIYDSVDFPVTGTVPVIGTKLKPDPLLRFVDSDMNGVWEGWNNSTADTAARWDYLTMLNETARLGWPVFNTEGGTFCGVSCPYAIPGAGGYSTVSLRYIQDIIDDEGDSLPRMGQLLWAAASWMKTPNAGEFGSLNPGQWGTIITTDTFEIVPIAHTITLTSIEITGATIPAGTKLEVGVTVRNVGEVPEAFDVTLDYSNTLIGQQIVYYLPVGAVQALFFTWDTSNVEPGGYVLEATSGPARGQNDLSSNTRAISVSVVSNTRKINDAGTGSSLWFAALVLPTASVAVIIAIAVGIVIVLRLRRPVSLLKPRDH